MSKKTIKKQKNFSELENLRILLSWDRNFTIEEVIEALKKGESPFFERAVERLGWFDLLKIFNTPENFFKILNKKLCKKDFTDTSEIFWKRVEDYLKLKELLVKS